MRGRNQLLVGAFCAWAASLSGCSCETSLDHHDAAPDADSDGDAEADGDVDEDVDGGTDAEADGDQDARPTAGPLTSVVSDLAFTTERICDIDRDGDLDNVLADLGSPAGDMGVIVLNTFVAGRMETLTRLLMHVPLVDDLTGPHDEEILAVISEGIDADEPPDPADDFLGDESFYIKAEHLDPCGEPLHYFEDGSIEDGQVTVTGDSVPLTLYQGVIFFASRVTGSVEPFGVTGQLSVCVHGTIHSLGDVDADIVEGLSMLELFVAGGSLVGIPSVPGFTPDLDFDGDGLEMLVVDEEGYLTSCIDGDRSVIEGRDCWQDERMADGFSMVVSMFGVSAHIAGLEPGWESEVEGTCEAPPAESLWGEP